MNKQSALFYAQDLATETRSTVNVWKKGKEYIVNQESIMDDKHKLYLIQLPPREESPEPVWTAQGLYELFNSSGCGDNWEHLEWSFRDDWNILATKLNNGAIPQ